MKPSAFNLRVPMPSGDVFLMNTLTDAQLLVSGDVDALLGRLHAETPDVGSLDDASQEALTTLTANGFVVSDRDAEQAVLRTYFEDFREDVSQMRITILTTLQCNFACDYCFQGDHVDGGRPAPKMSLQTSERVAQWVGGQLDTVRPSRLMLTFFGGEPLLNIPAMVDLAERCWQLTQARGIRQIVSIITNGLLLTPELVDQMLPLGLTGVKVTLDGDRDTHDRMRPLRGGQRTFDRIIENVRRVASKIPVAIGGNFDADTVESYPGLLDFLKSQDFADRISKVAFKPVIRSSSPAAPKGLIPLTPVGADRKPLNGTCMSVAGGGRSAASVCDNCHFADDQMSFLREETKRHGLPTPDGVHMGPCELYRRHSHTIGPDGTLYACPGFTGDNALAVGHISGQRDRHQAAAAEKFERLAPWRQCGDCSFIPVCGGGCAVSSHTELGDMEAPSCHKRSFESALVSLAEDTASTMAGGVQ